VTFLASDFFHSDTWYVLRNLLIFFGVIFWLAMLGMGLSSLHPR